MKLLLIISISALKAVAMMSRKTHLHRSPEQRETYAPKAQESAENLSHEEEIDVQLVPTEVLPDNVVDFQAARIRILVKRSLSQGAAP